MTDQPSGLAAALAALQAELPPVAKSKTAKVKGKTKQGVEFDYSYNYADLADVSAVVMPLMGRHGLSFTGSPTIRDDGKFGLAYQLMHSGGESIAGFYPLDPSMTPQQIGGHITYARRYCLCAVTGVAAEEDTDMADTAAGRHTAQRRQATRPAAATHTPAAEVAPLADGSGVRTAGPGPEGAPSPPPQDRLPPLPGEEDELEVSAAGHPTGSYVDRDKHGTATRGKGGQLTALWTVLHDVFEFDDKQKDQARGVAEHIIGRDLPGTTGDLSFNEARTVLDTLASWQKIAESRKQEPREVMIAVMVEAGKADSDG